MQEFHVGPVSAWSSPGWLEVNALPIDRNPARPLTVEAHRAIAPPEPGLGVSFDRGRRGGAQEGKVD